MSLRHVRDLYFTNFTIGQSFILSCLLSCSSTSISLKYTYVFGVGLVTLMRMCGEVMTSQSRAGTWYAAYPP